jgi:hypothetical protein
MAAAGRPILPSGLSKIEQGQRAVDVDDLVALAIALQVNPNALLLPAGIPELTDNIAMTGDSVTDEQFEAVVAEAKAEGDLSRANVARKMTDEGTHSIGLMPLTETVSARWWRAWEWATGEAPLGVPDSDHVRLRLSDLAQWFESTRPHKDRDEIAAELAAAARVRVEHGESIDQDVKAAQTRWRAAQQHDDEGDSDG